MLFGVFSIIGRLLAGPLADRFGALVVWPSGLVSSAAMLLWLASARNCNNITYSMAALGLASGPVIALVVPLLVELFGMKRLPLALGPMMLINGIGGFFSPATAGFIRDLTDSYRIAFACCSIFQVLAGLIMLIVKVLHCRRQESKPSSTESPVAEKTSAIEASDLTETAEELVSV